MGYPSAMTLATLDFLSGTTCQLTPYTQPWGPGWYLIAANDRVEAGPFATPADAERASAWLDDRCLGVHPAWEQGEVYGDGEPPYHGPAYQPRWSSSGLLVGSRIRTRKKSMAQDLAPTG